MQLRITLNTTETHIARLQELQHTFAQACNALTPVVQRTRTWNRVALHHLVYKDLREKFPALGSQMACNAIYSVSRTCRLLFQHPASPFNISLRADKPLPLVTFSPNCPVYFDRHTLSLKAGSVSMFTLDGRMHFQLALSPEDESNFHRLKLREIVLRLNAARQYELDFTFDPQAPADIDSAAPSAEVPEYILLEEAP